MDKLLAANGQTPTLDWATGIQPLLATTFSAFNKNDVPEIAKNIVKSEGALLSSDKDHEPFCSSVVALASHYLGAAAPTLPKSHLSVVTAASKVLLRYLLANLDSSPEHRVLSQSQILQLIRCLCRGTLGLHRNDVAFFVSRLKSEDLKVPGFCRVPRAPEVAADSSASKDKENANPATNADVSSPPPQASKRPRLGDTTINLFEQLTSVFHEVIASGSGAGSATHLPLRSIYASLTDNATAAAAVSAPAPPASTTSTSPSTGSLWTTTSGSLSHQPPAFVGHLVADPQEEMRMLFAHKNLASFKALRGREILLETCYALPCIVRYVVKHEEVMLGSDLALPGNGVCLPVSPQEAAVIKATLPALLADVCVVYRAFQLPVLEPLTPARLQKVTGVTMACLHAALNVVAAVESFPAVGSNSSKTSASQPLSTTPLPASSSASGAPLAQRSKSVPDPKNLQGVPSLIDETDAQQLATAVVHRCLDVFNLAAEAIKSSSRAGGHVFQNTLLIGSWTLLSGLKVMLSLSNAALADGPAKTQPRKHLSTSDAPDSLQLSPLPILGQRPSSSSIHSERSTLNSGATSHMTASLVTFALNQLAVLMSDLELETDGDSPLFADTDWYSPPESVEMIAALPTDLLTTYTARQRFSILKHGCRMPRLLLGFVFWAFKRASAIARLKLAPRGNQGGEGDGNSSTTSDSNTYYEDDFSSSEDSSDDDEPILGQWITSTLATASPPSTSGSRRRRRAGKSAMAATAEESEDDAMDLDVDDRLDGPVHDALMTALFEGDADNDAFAPGALTLARGTREQIAGLVYLAAETLNFVETRFVSSQQPDVKRCLSEALGDEELASLAFIIREMDGDASLATLASSQTSASPGASLFASVTFSPSLAPSSPTTGSPPRPALPPFQTFSVALSRFTHGLVATQLLDHNKQDRLLYELNISPVSVDPWPLSVPPRTLGVLAQVLLLRLQPGAAAPQQRSTHSAGAVDPLSGDSVAPLDSSALGAQLPTPSASMGLKSSAEAAIVNIWVRLLNTLKRDILTARTDADDVNVEHAQLLLFLFHTLPLMQKKSLLLQLARTIITVVDGPPSVASVSKTRLGHALEYLSPLPLTRLLLVFEYLLHNFYDPPAMLFEQVTWNLFTSFVLPSSTPGGAELGLTVPAETAGVSEVVGGTANGNSTSNQPTLIQGSRDTRLYFPCEEVEDPFQKSSPPSSSSSTFKPRFYGLGPSTDPSPREPAKVDGLACAFLVGAQEALNYNHFYDCAVATLSAGTALDLVSTSALDRGARHYHFLVAWRLLGALPPSPKYLAMLENQTIAMPDSYIMHTLRWAPRLASVARGDGKTQNVAANANQSCFAAWAKDWLVKHGMTSQKADALLFRVGERVASVNFNVNLAQHFFIEILAKTHTVRSDEILPLSGIPSLATVSLMDAVVAKAQMALDQSFPANGEAASETDNPAQMAQDLLPPVFALVSQFVVYAKSCLLGRLESSEGKPFDAETLKALGMALSVASTRAPAKVSSLGISVISWLPSCVRSALELWNSNAGLGSAPQAFPAAGAWRNPTTASAVLSPHETYLDDVLFAHIRSLSNEPSSSSSHDGLRHVLHSLVRLSGDLVELAARDDLEAAEESLRVLLPLVLDATTEGLVDFSLSTLERVLGSAESDPFAERLYFRLVSRCHDVSTLFQDRAAVAATRQREVTTDDPTDGLDERVLHEIFKFLESNADRAPLQSALARFYADRVTDDVGSRRRGSDVEKADLVDALLSAGNENLSPAYAGKVLKFFNRLFQLAQERCPGAGWTGGPVEAAVASEDPSPPPPPLPLADAPPPILLPPILASPPMLAAPPPPAVHPLIQLTSSLTRLARLELTALTDLLSVLLLGKKIRLGDDDEDESPTQEMFSSVASSFDVKSATDAPDVTSSLDVFVLENRGLLQKMINFLVRDSSPTSETVALALLEALIPIGRFMLDEKIGSDETTTPTTSSASPLVGFPQLMVVMATLAGAGRSGRGHTILFSASLEWLTLCKRRLDRRRLVEVLRSDLDACDAESRVQEGGLDCLCFLLSYVGEILGALKMASSASSLAKEAPAEGDGAGQDWFLAASTAVVDAADLGFLPSNVEATAVDAAAVVDSGDEDSEEESSLCNKVCTYTVTQKEFMNQHWYHCHTCKMVDGVGVCTICAKVCHKDHDVTYAKYGSFFCDCGAKEDGSCIALVKRPPRTASQGVENVGAAPSTSFAPVSNDSASRSAAVAAAPLSAAGAAYHDDGIDAPSSAWDLQLLRARQSLAKVVETQRGPLVEAVVASNVTQTVLNVLQDMIFAYTRGNADSKTPIFPIGSAAKSMRHLKDLHTLEKKVETVENLMTPTLGSQEGAFENVRMNYSGDQGQQIRQLISAHMLRRVAMCVMASPLGAGAGSGKRQHLAVAHEKGKITILQLSALLRQADSSKKKLTLTRLHSAPVPFTALSISSNPCNEDVLAVTGLRDCHVLVFGPSGSVTDHIVLHPGLETGNFIIKALWLPGSQSELAVVTADFVKIYDLAADALSPHYYFLLPTGKIRDATLVFPPEGDAAPTILFMASSGYVYSQAMEDFSCARHGPFYVTNVLEVNHEDLTETPTSGGGPGAGASTTAVGGGGVSLHYSHALQLLFFSFACGKSFAAPINAAMTELAPLFPIAFKSSAPASSSNNKSTSNGNNGQQQPLCGWNEVAGHPGLVTCLTQTVNNPVILMVRPRSIDAQEIRVTPTGKAKIQDMVAIRHPASGAEHRTTLILLCEDGSLRIYMANSDATNFWINASSPLHGGSSQLAVGLVGPPRGPSLQRKRGAAHGPGAEKGSRGSSLGPACSSTRGSTPANPTGGSQQPAPHFPVDFFENCQQTNDVEFGGRDLLEVYNAQQLKHRLQVTGLYVANTKLDGFSLEIKNPNHATSVMVGLRVQLGVQAVEKTCTYLRVFGRAIPVPILTKSRWFDLPFTREESLTADKKITVEFGSTRHEGCVNIVDCVRVFVLPKETFGFPDDADDHSSSNSQPIGTNNSNAADVAGASHHDEASSLTAANAAQHHFQQHPLTPCDRLLAKSLDAVEGALASTTSTPSREQEVRLSEQKSMALEVATSLLAIPTAVQVQRQIKGLLAALHPSPLEYHSHKDRAQLAHAQSFVDYWMSASGGAEGSRGAGKEEQIDPEAFQRILAVVRAIAVQRPANLISSTSRPVFSVKKEADRPDSQATPMPWVQKLTLEESEHFASRLVQIFWRLLLARPQNSALAAVGLPGLTCVEATVQALVDVIHAYTVTPCEDAPTASTSLLDVFVDPINTRLATKLYASLLLCPEQSVSFAAKSALLRILKPSSMTNAGVSNGSFGPTEVSVGSFQDGGGGGGGSGGSGHRRRRPSGGGASSGPRGARKVFIPSPPRCSTPGAAVAGSVSLDADDMDDDLEDVMADDDMEDDELMQTPPPIDILAPGNQDAVLMIDSGSVDGGMRINLGEALLASGRRGGLRGALRSLRGAAAAAAGGSSGRLIGRGARAERNELRAAASASGAAGGRALVIAAHRGRGRGAPSSRGRPGGVGAGRSRSGDLDFLSVEDLEMDESDLIQPDDDDDDDVDDEDDVDDDDEEDEDEDEMVDVIEADGRNRTLDLEEFSQVAASRPSSSGVPPPPRPIRIPDANGSESSLGSGAGVERYEIVDQVEPLGESGAVSGASSRHSGAGAPPPVDAAPSLEALLAGRGQQLLGGPGAGVVGFPPILDIPPDADDEAMMELAIALSLQDQSVGGGVAGGGPGDPPPPLNLLQDLQAFSSVDSNASRSAAPSSIAVEAPTSALSVGVVQSNANSSGAALMLTGDGTGRYSDTTTSAPGSDDDEGSTAATEGSTLRTSPAADRDGGGSPSAAGGSGQGASEEGSGSVSDEDAGVSAGDPSRSGSSAYGEVGAAAAARGEHQRGGGGGGGGGGEPPASAALSSEAVDSRSTGHPTAAGGAPQQPPPTGGLQQKRLHRLRLLLLEDLLQYMSHLKEGGGVRSIPYMQVLLMLSSDLDGAEERDVRAMTGLLNVLRKHLDEFRTSDSEEGGEVARLAVVDRSPASEVDLIVMRFYSVLMSRTSSSKSKSDSSSSFASNATAKSLLSADAIRFCLRVLQQLLPYWTALEVTSADTPPTAAPGASTTPAASVPNSPGTLIKPHPPAPPPDMSPFFLRQYVKGHAGDVFEAFPQLLTEMVLRLPLQIKKLTDGAAKAAALLDVADGVVKSKVDEATRLESAATPVFDQQSWFRVLCEYMMTQETPFVRRQVRKLLLFICGTKTKYRHLRDLHALETHMKQLRQLCLDERSTQFLSPSMAGGAAAEESRLGRAPTFITMAYETRLALIEHLKACAEIAGSRTDNWQKFCLENDDVVTYLLTVSYQLDEGVAPLLLQLLQAALCSSKCQQEGGSTSSRASPTRARSSTPAVSGATAPAATEKKEAEKNDSDTEGCVGDENACVQLVHQLLAKLSETCFKTVSRAPDPLALFIRSFLLESNATAVRWQAHALLLSIYRNATLKDREMILDLMWSLWAELPNYGRKAAQFVDLLGYFSLKRSDFAAGSGRSGEEKATDCESKLLDYVSKAVDVLRRQNHIICASHPNANIYTMLSALVEFDGFYLESDPCLVCNNPEVPFSNLKLAAIKVDSRFTTTTQIVKLVGSHVISKIALRVGDLKRTKMVRTINLYYNNRAVQSVVELKNRPDVWHKAKKVVLAAGQTEVKLDFPLPIVACNLMIEYADFYDNFTATTETLQCPRCSASVPANPGVCGNCGENVYQCHKCRSINYDEKDPFLCNACGFCKYAKFDYTLTGKACCAVDPIENEEDRKKAIQSINGLLEKADRVYKTLVAFRPSLEALLLRVYDHGSDSTPTGDPLVDGVVGNLAVINSLPSGVPQGHPAGASGGVAPVPPTSVAGGLTSVNLSIQKIAQRYCGDCKASFEDLSKIIQKVLATRKELVEYDRKQREASIRRAAVATSVSATPLAWGSGVVASSSMVSSATTPLSEMATSGAMTSSTVGADESCQESLESPRPAGRCYGCATASVEHCITLLRALANNPVTKRMLCDEGLVRELIDFNLRRGSPLVRLQVRTLLCILTKNNPSATSEMNALLMTRIGAAIRGHLSNPELASSVRHEMALLFTSMQIPGDYCWEQRLRCVLRLFLLSLGVKGASPVILEIVTLPCLKILRGLIAPPNGKQKNGAPASSASASPVAIDVRRWLSGDDVGLAPSSYDGWRAVALHDFKSSAGKPPLPARPSKDGNWKDKKFHRKIIRERFLVEKYFAKWKMYCRFSTASKRADAAGESAPAASSAATRDLLGFALGVDRRDPASFNWLRRSLFTSSSRSLRQVAATIVVALAHQQNLKRRQEILDMLTGFLDELHVAGESGGEFLTTYQTLIKEDHWKYYLVVKGKLLPKICGLINKELAHLARLEETSLSSDLSLGYTLKALTELLSSLVAQDAIKANYKSRGLLATVLNGYLSLRKLVVQRTKLIDETQDKMLELLEDMTSGTESELKSFMTICVETVHKYGVDDYRTPVFVFERLCSIVYPEANEIGEFFLALEKDPQQEDFLQGRMMGNPYSSNEPGLGPLMRDVKNKICQDCELVALLEDDSGMELLVNNKIIGLDLPVKDVYKKIWLGEAGNQEGDPMRVVYRMRGLLGDATEDMVETLDTNNDDDVDNEEVFKMAAVLSTGSPSGLEVMLWRLAAVTDLVRGRHLLLTLLKLFSFCVKVGANRKALLQPHLNAISVMLASLNMVLHAGNEALSSPGSGQPSIAEMLVEIMEAIFTEASLEPPGRQKEFSAMCGDRVQLVTLLERIYSPHVRAHVPVMQSLMRLVPFLSFGDEEKIGALIDHFKQFMDFEKYDTDHTSDDTLRLECVCVVTSGILMNANGERLKDAFVEKGVVTLALNYVIKYAPPVTTYLATDHDDWKDFLAKPALPFVLRLLTGLSQGHSPTQSLLGSTGPCIPVFHKLEQVSTNAAIGSLSENLLEALREHPSVAKAIEEIREKTKSEKKRRAMDMREKQLKLLGMKTNNKGQVLAKQDLLVSMGEVMDESGLTCCICREGYKFHPQKVLAIYTFSKRANVEDMETKTRKTQGYATVSHFNVVHVDCHNSAVRMQRGRDEWESAALQNANTRCNGLLPLWGPQVPESAFANCLARHNNYLQESTGVRDTTYPLALHDIKQLLLRFAFEKSFSDETGGGGPESNLHLIPYLFQMALYVINTTRAYPREEKSLNQFLGHPPGSPKWLESPYDTESPFFWTTTSMAIQSGAAWRRNRLALLDRLLISVHCHHVMPGGGAKLTDKDIKPYSVYKPAIVLFGLVDAFYRILWSKVAFDVGGGAPGTSAAAAAADQPSWSQALSEWIRHNDTAITESLPKLLEFYKDEILPVESLDEALDVLGLLGDVPNAEEHLKSLLQPLPS